MYCNVYFPPTQNVSMAGIVYIPSTNCSTTVGSLVVHLQIFPIINPELYSPW